MIFIALQMKMWAFSKMWVKLVLIMQLTMNY